MQTFLKNTQHIQKQSYTVLFTSSISKIFKIYIHFFHNNPVKKFTCYFFLKSQVNWSQLMGKFYSSRTFRDPGSFKYISLLSLAGLLAPCALCKLGHFHGHIQRKGERAVTQQQATSLNLEITQMLYISLSLTTQAFISHMDQWAPGKARKCILQLDSSGLDRRRNQIGETTSTLQKSINISSIEFSREYT